VFRGEVSLSLDPKGRLAIPTRQRERILDLCSGALVATISLTERCLAVYPAPSWRRIEEQLQALPAFDSQAQAITRLLIGHASECEMDGQGRILLPATLREFAGLDRRVRMIGHVNKFELWDEDLWVARRSELLGQVGTMLREPSESIRSLVL
jgi:MraZ protein